MPVCDNPGTMRHASSDWMKQSNLLFAGPQTRLHGDTKAAMPDTRCRTSLFSISQGWCIEECYSTHSCSDGQKGASSRERPLGLYFAWQD